MAERTGSVFVSYSRRDRDIAERLVERLRNEGFETLRDVDDILPTEAWRERLEVLIRKADSIVFLLSPHSAVSEICAWEVEFANSLSKKIAPIVIEDVAGADIPPMLARLNYIFATKQDRFDNAVQSLCDALGCDIDWIREHSRLLDLAHRWTEGGSWMGQLLRGDNLLAAEKWANARPATTPPISSIIIEFIEASRRVERMAADYDRAKLLALSKTIEPILKKHVTKLQTRAATADQQTPFRVSTVAADIRLEIESIENFYADNGVWHPEPAIHVQTADGSADYAEVYKFPCCEKITLRRDRSQPSQFRADGCSRNPQSE
jgi:TIR domain